MKHHNNNHNKMELVYLKTSFNDLRINRVKLMKIYQRALTFYYTVGNSK